MKEIIIHLQQRSVSTHAPRTIWLAILAALVFFFIPRAIHAQSNCATDSQSGYTVTICIDAPGDGSTVSGDTTVQVSVSVSGNNPGIRRVVAYLDGADLITDFASPYTFQLPSDHFIDGKHTLAAEALMRDNVTTKQAKVNLNFKNGIKKPPVNTNQFTPHTPSAQPGQPLILAATGDGPDGQSSAASVADLVNGWNPDLVLYLGDVYQDGTMAEFYNWYGTQGNLYGQFRNITNPTIGNHEYENGVAPGYFDYWDNVPNYYSYDAGGWHFVALNSDSHLGEYGPGTAQYDWMVQDLNASSSHCTIAYFHHPVYSVGKQGDTPQMNQIWSQLVQQGADIVLVGHEHNYQRWQPLGANGMPDAQGVVEFVAGGGGHGIQNFVKSDTRMVVGVDTPAQGFGALYLALNPDGAAFHYTNIQGEIIDSGVIPCTGAPTDNAAPTTPQNLTASVDGAGKPVLDWSAANDNTGVLGYTIYRDGAQIATVDGVYTTFADLSAQSSSAYTYRVDAYDPAGNHSAQSNSASVSTPGAAAHTFYPVADVYVKADLPNNNYGGSTYLRADASPATRSYLRFDVQGINSAIQSVTLRVHTNNGSGIGYQVYDVADDAWSELGTTYNNAPNLGAQLGASGPFGSNEWTTVDLTSFVTGDGVLSLALDTTSSTSLSMDSRETSDKPELVIETSDAPPTPTPTITPTPTATLTPTPGPTSPPGLFTYAPVADAYVNGANPNNNYGSSASLRTDASPDVRSYLRFDMPDLGGYIQSATLRVYANSGSSIGYRVHNVADNTWVESAITYNSAPGMDNPAAWSGGFSAGAWTEVDVTSLVSGPGTLSLAMSSTSSTAVRLDSREGPNAPQLIVETSGAPPTPPPVGGTFTFTPEADAYVHGGKPDSNYGNSSKLRVDASPDKRSYLRFSVAGVTGAVTDATLRVYASSGSNSGYDVVDVADDSWQESSITYANAPAVGGLVGSSGAFGAGTWTEMDVTSLVSGDGLVSVALSGISNTGISLSSSEGSNPPELVITASSARMAMAASAGPPLDQAAYNQWLQEHGLTPGATNALRDADPDGDGLPNGDEFANNIDPGRLDSDGDGLPDLWEVENGLSPLIGVGDDGPNGDPDRDGVVNLVEYQTNGDPFYPERGDALPPEGDHRVFLPLVSGR